jgi:sugar phosphate isomerase/epimerase
MSLFPEPGFSNEKKEKGLFRFCLNTSTISGQKPGLKKYLEIAAEAGYDGVELWVHEIQEYKQQGNSLKTLKKFLDDSRLSVYDVIGFAPWMVEDEKERKAGFEQMKQEMEMVAELGCSRIAAPSAGVKADTALDLNKIGERYKIF